MVSESAALPVGEAADADARETARSYRNELLLVAFTSTTNVADAVTRVALPLLAAALTSSPGAIAAVVVLMSLPWLVTALHVGVIVDRMNRRSLMLFAEASRTITVGLLLATVLADVVTLPLIYALAVVLGVADVVASTAGAAVVPSAVIRSRWQSASARITAAEYLCNGFVGAPIGGFLVAAGFAVALGTTGAVYLAGAVMLLLLVGSFKATASVERRSIHAELRDGLRFLWRHKLLRTMALLIAVMAGCWGSWFALIPAYAVGGPLGLDARQYGFVLTALGAGGVVGAVAVGPVNRVIGRRWSMFADIVGTFALVAIPAALPARPASAVPVAAAAFLAGVGGTMWTVNSRVIIQSHVPDELLGRFSAASRLVGWGTVPIAAGIAGAIAQFASFRAAFGLFAVMCAALVYPYLRVMTAEVVSSDPHE